MDIRKEIAKVAVGVSGHEVLSHALLSGSGLLPLKVFGITVTPGYNSIIIIVWTLVTVALVYYAWFKKS